MRALNRRVLALEAGKVKSAGCFVLTYGLHETAADALRRAPGSYVVVGDVLPPEVWEPLAAAQQRQLLLTCAADH